MAQESRRPEHALIHHLNRWID